MMCIVKYNILDLVWSIIVEYIIYILTCKSRSKLKVYQVKQLTSAKLVKVLKKYFVIDRTFGMHIFIPGFIHNMIKWIKIFYR